MLTSLSLIFLVGLAMGAICSKLKLPRIIGMLATGIILGPYVLDLLDPSILSISAELRKMALVIILLKAGLSLNLQDLKKVGRPAIMLSFVPATFEIIGYILLAPIILGLTHTEAAVMGAVLSAVSPAVVIPRMVQLMDNKYGTDQAIPQMIMAGASCYDIFKHGAGWWCQSDLFPEYSNFNHSWYSSRCHCRLWTLSFFRNRLCPQTLCAKQYESDNCSWLLLFADCH